ncbi:MAG: leucine-rich repeat domain-containing protein, partial [Thermoguttaceae bacterium]|nr:leucine-rich repeat domain-containing protein [Thermoguttaceae bacterium]
MENADYVDKETERFVVPEGVKRISFHDFWFWDKLRRVVIPASVEEVDDNAFFDSGALEAFEVAEDNSRFRSIDGVLFSKDGKTLVKYPEGIRKDVCVVPEGVEKIARRAFYHCVSLTSIVVPQSLKTIVAGAFAECFALESFDVPENVGKIGSNAFFLCCKLKAINVAENNARYRSIDGVLFSKGGKTLLKCPEGTETEEYRVPQGVETIEEDAFALCSALKKIVLPKGVVNIGDGAFTECSSLDEFFLPDGLITIGERGLS